MQAMWAPTWHQELPQGNDSYAKPRLRGVLHFLCYIFEMRFRWLLFALCLASLLALLQMYAIAHFLYWHFRWLDTPMHVLGGATVGAFVASARPLRPWQYIFLVAAASLGWEIFEYTFHLSQPPGSYLLDTIHDLVNDATGAWFIYRVARETVWRSK